MTLSKLQTGLASRVQPALYRASSMSGQSGAGHETQGLKHATKCVTSPVPHIKSRILSTLSALDLKILRVALRCTIQQEGPFQRELTGRSEPWDLTVLSHRDRRQVIRWPDKSLRPRHALLMSPMGLLGSQRPLQLSPHHLQTKPRTVMTLQQSLL